MADISLPWGRETLEIQLPENWTLLQTAQPDLPPARPEWPENLARALMNPEGLPPLAKMLQARRTGKIVLIVEDISRHSPTTEILKPILKEIAFAKVPAENVLIFFATGMHPAMTAEQAAAKVGRDVIDQYAWMCNDARNLAPYDNLGRLELAGIPAMELLVHREVAQADLRILVNSVTPHLQAGFGGGYKMILPGCSHVESIRPMHRACLPNRATQQVGSGGDTNVLRRLMDAAGEKLEAFGGKTFGVQYLLDQDDQPSAVAAGEVGSCQQMLAKQCAAACGVMVEQEADIVIANAYPRDSDLWQSFKSIAHATWAAREKGVVICFSRCEGGANMPTFHLPVSPRMVRSLVRTLGSRFIGNLVASLSPDLAGDALFFIRLASQCLERTSIYMVSPNLVEHGVKLLGLPLFASAQEAFAAAEKELGEGAKRVNVFPQGGISYPLPRRRIE